MTDEISTQPGGGEALPANTEKAPTSDGLSQITEATAEATTPDPAIAEKEKADAAAAEEKKKNRTREYINRINREAAELRQRVAEMEARQAPAPRQQPAANGEPTLEEHNFDITAFQRAHSKWAVESTLAERDAAAKQQAEQTKQHDTWATYETRAADFTDAHPDFLEVVGSIAYPLAPELQAAIAAHERGPELAYHLGTNDDEAFQLASIQPHLAAAAVERLASRLSAAPQAPVIPAAAIAPITPKPISQAPPPAPTVGGRASTETPPEKLTDDEWFKREREKERKRS